jgi:tetratricopeptide (TPR) repeat protein
LPRLATTLGLILSFSLTQPTRGDSPDLGALRAALADDAVPLDERARRALEGAASLDQAAQRTTQASERRARWSQAVGLLDGFVEAHPDVDLAPLIRFQAAVYQWAEGRSFAEQAELAPSDPKTRPEAYRTLDDSIRRFREIKIKSDPTDVLAQNVRFRLAQAIADFARLDPENSSRRQGLEREALGMLDGSPATPALRPFVRLLRGELANRLGLFGQAQIEVEQAEKLDPAPPPEALLEAKVVALSGRTQYDEARKAIESAKVGEPLKRLLNLRIALTRRRERPPGRERRESDDEAFRIAEPFRGATNPEGRRALMELARTIDEPGPDSPPDWWDLLAEGHLRIGDPVRAGRLVAKGGDRAEAAGQLEKAASLRYKAGAYLFEAGKFAEADRRLTQVVDQPAAPRDVKGRAGMLRALARGRAVATRQPDASRASYLAALEALVRDYPDLPTTGEARWLLGQVRLSAGRFDDAMSLWSGIAHGHPRWLESRALIADRLREAVDAQRINRDSAAVIAKMDLARRSLKAAIDQASEGPEVVALTLLLARLELTPDAGRPPVAIEASDRVLKLAAPAEQHQAARLYRMVALAESNRGIEAERAARAEAGLDGLTNVLLSLRLLDRAATEADSETIRRRIGLIARIITSKLIDHIDEIPEGSRDEAHLHHARALLFSGDPAGARKEIAGWGGPVAEVDDELLRELADTYQRLDAFVLAIDAERYRSGRLAPGSLPWLESRYGMALAYYRADRPKDARQLIDATAILHPDLGGGELKTRFERLRQKIGQD